MAWSSPGRFPFGAARRRCCLATVFRQINIPRGLIWNVVGHSSIDRLIIVSFSVMCCRPRARKCVSVFLYMFECPSGCPFAARRNLYRQAAIRTTNGGDSWRLNGGFSGGGGGGADPVHDQSLRHCCQFDTQLDGRDDRSVPRFLPVRLRRLDTVASHSAGRVALGHVRNAATEEPDRAQESAR